MIIMARSEDKSNQGTCKENIQNVVLSGLINVNCIITLAKELHEQYEDMRRVILRTMW